jgi:hypothetical protein
MLLFRFLSVAMLCWAQLSSLGSSHGFMLRSTGMYHIIRSIISGQSLFDIVCYHSSLRPTVKGSSGCFHIVVIYTIHWARLPRGEVKHIT